MKNISLKSCKLYLILDAQVTGYAQLLKITQKAIAGGVDIVQLRDKYGLPRNILEFSRELKKIIRGKVPFIMNDRVDLAKAAGASGVHLGQDDLGIDVAIKILGPKAMIGVSCQTITQARQAQKDHVDYIGFGSVFKTLTKPERVPMKLDLLANVLKEISVPVFAIGGIDLKRLPSLKPVGVTRVAVCREILKSNDVQKTTAKLKKILMDQKDS